MAEFILKLFPYNNLFPPNNTWNNVLSFVLILAIIVYAIIEFLRFTYNIHSIESNIKEHAKKLPEFNNHATESFEEIKDLFLSNELLRDKWEEYEFTLIKRDNPRRIYKTEYAETYFNDSSILSHRINVRYWYALPGILVGLGIFGTFIGLTLGLSQLKTDSIENIQSGIDMLMSGMTTAFSTSVWGMGFSLLFNWYEKKRFNGLSSVISRLNRQTDKLFTLTTQEKIMFDQSDQIKIQTTALQAFSTDLADRIRIAMDSIMASRLDSLQGVVEKLYKEGEGSTNKIVTEIKASGDNMTKSLQEAVGNIMIEKLSPSLEKVANSINALMPVVESLRQEKQESSLDAIKKLVEEFKTSLSSNTKGEMEKLSNLIRNAGESLSMFPAYLEEMKVTLNNQSLQIKQLLEETSSKVKTEMEGMTDKMRKEADKTIVDFGVVIESLQDNVKQILIRQESNAQIVEALINNSKTILQKGNELTHNMEGSIRTILDSIGQLRNTVKELSTSSELFSDVTEKIMIITNNFSEQGDKHLEANRKAIENITTTLGKSAQLLEGFNIMESGLQNIFKQIENGLIQYSQAARDNLNKYLSDFSNQFSQAAKQLGGGIEYLGEVVNALEGKLNEKDK
ncbi:MAG: hypothetical protein A3C43_00160 [Candidatus Schekmanbacteria bacterium RIFCSPHIGHO2_02_FULL_38_11]|nr:MAG: hypothetical protein A3C43_00160 [Candidatus Schekmanbacteria bacterium RIFCSPHIGHO2_02_FULL_38_11]